MNTPNDTFIDDRKRVVAERAASAPRVLDLNRNLPRSHCRSNHPAMRRDDSWRDVPLEHQCSLSRKGGLSEVVPLATNGLLVYCKGEILAHFSNIEWPEKAVQHFTRKAKPKVSTLRKPRAPKTAPLIDPSDLF